MIFIIGVGRSGTSLLQSMLNAHSEICFLPETQFLRKYLFNRKKKVRLERLGVVDFTRILRKDYSFSRLNIDPEVVTYDQEQLSIRKTYKRVLDIYLKRKGKILAGDKDPRNLDFIKSINESFPDARIIHIIRDPRDVVLSRTKADWSKSWPFFMHPAMYNTQIVRGRSRAKELLNERYFELFYEDLIKDPEPVLEQICTFLNVAYDQDMLQYQQAAKELVSDSEMQWKKETMGPLLTHNKEKWKAAFTNYQITLTEKICAPAMKELPYKSYGKWDALSFWEKVKIQCAIVFSKVFAIIYPLRVKWL